MNTRKVAADVTSAALMCKSCGADLPPSTKFCNECGAAVAATTPAEYKQVTVLFADDAIDELHATFASHMAGGSRVFVGCAGEALVGLLIERGSTDDLAEAHRIVDQWQEGRPGIPALDLWWLKSRALWAKTEDDSEGFAELAIQYLELCEKLDARGRLDEARQLINQIA